MTETAIYICPDCGSELKAEIDCDSGRVTTEPEPPDYWAVFICPDCPFIRDSREGTADIVEVSAVPERIETPIDKDEFLDL